MFTFTKREKSARKMRTDLFYPLNKNGKDCRKKVPGTPYLIEGTTQLKKWPNNFIWLIHVRACFLYIDSICELVLCDSPA